MLVGGCPNHAPDSGKRKPSDGFWTNFKISENIGTAACDAPDRYQFNHGEFNLTLILNLVAQRSAWLQ